MKKELIIPPIGLGSYLLKGEQAIELIRAAFAIGYRHFDTAINYENQRAIGKAISTLPRDQLFITSKFMLNLVDEKDIEKSVQQIVDSVLKELDMSYVDLFLIHWPDESKPILKIWHALQRCQQEGKIRFIGVSNFSKEQLKMLLDNQIKPAVNQIEFHPYLYQKELLQFCKQEEIQVVAYRSFGKGALLQERALQEVAAATFKSVAQILLRFALQHGVCVIPKASSEAHLKENFDTNFILTPDQMQQLEALHENKRFCKPERFN